MGPFFPGFTISNAVIGMIYGLFLWRERWSAKKKQGVLYKKNTGLLLRTAIAHLVKTAAVSLFLNIIWLSKFYGMPASVVLTGTLAKEAVNFPFEAALIYLVIRALSRLGI
jgi:ECF transporter S component (folate family)